MLLPLYLLFLITDW